MWKYLGIVLFILCCHSVSFSQTLNNRQFLSWFSKLEIPDWSSNPLANDKGALKNDEADRIRSFLRMYKTAKLSGDIQLGRKYLEISTNRITNLLNFRDDRRNVIPPVTDKISYIDVNGYPQIKPVWRSLKYSKYKLNNNIFTRYNSSEERINQDIQDEFFAYPYLMHSGKILLPVAEFIYLVDSNNLTQYKAIRDTFLLQLQRTIDFHNGNEWREDSSLQSGYYVLRNDVSKDLIPQNYNPTATAPKLPLNMMAAMGSVLAMISSDLIKTDPLIYTEAKKEAYKIIAQKIARNFKNSLKYDAKDSCYLWTYWGNNYVKNGGEDIGHASLNVEFAYISFKMGDGVFNHEDMLRFTKTFDRYIYQGNDPKISGDQLPKIANSIDGHDGIIDYKKNRYDYLSVYDWIFLCEFDQSIFDKLLNITKYLESDNLKLNRIWIPVSRLSEYESSR